MVTNCELPLMFHFISSNLYSFYIGTSYIMTQQSMTMLFMKENKKIKKKKGKSGSVFPSNSDDAAELITLKRCIKALCLNN